MLAQTDTKSCVLLAGLNASGLEVVVDEEGWWRAMAQLTITDKDDVVVVSFTESKILDEGIIRQIGEEFKKLSMEAAAERKLLLRFNRVTFMSSAMIGQVMRLAKQCKADKIDLKLCDISPVIMEVFKITRLDKVLDIHKTEADGFSRTCPGPRAKFGGGS
jgi:anti-sigma B factor antagonist